MKSILLLALILMGSVKSFANESEANVLNFEADVIEGERKNPNVFIQLDVGTPNLDTVLFQRSNFNDFHAQDKNRRPLLQSREAKK